MKTQIDYGLMSQAEIPQIQAMMQDVKESLPYHFNLRNHHFFVARLSELPIGFVFGERGYGNSSHILTIRMSFILAQFKRFPYEKDMNAAFLSWARNCLGVTNVEGTHISPSFITAAKSPSSGLSKPAPPSKSEHPLSQEKLIPA